MTIAIERSAMRKIYLRLLPLAGVSYLLAYIDRINVSFAGLTMRDVLNMSAGAFGFALGTFYWGYSIFELPSNLIMERVGARLWIARIISPGGSWPDSPPRSVAPPASASCGFCSASPRRGFSRG
jgi:ACS family tartrate transporter-like MFS transporter